MIQYRIVETNGKFYIECLPLAIQLQSEADALDLVAACEEHGTNLLLIYEENLPDAFFDLRSGLAGAVLLKLRTYRICTAAVIGKERASAGRFGEFVLETNRGQAFRVFPDHAAAVDWLVRQANG